jgi:hypothetical protein
MHFLHQQQAFVDHIANKLSHREDQYDDQALLVLARQVWHIDPVKKTS